MSEREFRGTHRFQLLSCLGAGGMGVVYRAFDRERGREVALKAIRNQRPEAILRFKREFHALQDLAHSNLVRLDELFFDEGQWFFTMELVEGVDFLRWVRDSESPPFDWSRSTAPLEQMAESAAPVPPAAPGSLLDENRLRAGLRQLACGLSALHDAGKVHRDIKPSNILCTSSGRVVLLDFGLVADVALADEASERDVGGTTAYMAPEQAACAPVGRDSDLYALGVVLFEALTGRRPFEGTALEVLANKQRFEATPPHAYGRVPSDLDELCVELLRRERTQRPSAHQLRQRLDGHRGAPTAPPAMPTELALFVGRTAELAELRAAFADVLAGNGITVFVRGESGVGKSALVRQFTATLPPEAVVLTGRCYERESVPYKAFDGLIDALARDLRRRPKADAAALLPRRAALLPQVFPALARIAAFAEAPRGRAESTDPQELRARLFAALRELLTRLGERQPLVLVIDDLQWADADSFALLTELTRPPDPPALLLIAMLRADAPTPSLAGASRTFVLDRLSTDDALALAQTLLERAGGTADVASPAALAAEAGGHPMFIDELVRHAAARRQKRGPLRLDEALALRIGELEPAARRLLELAAVAGTPLAHTVAADAAEVDEREIDQRVALLRAANLTRSGQTRGTLTFEIYHDRLREAVLAQLDEPTRRARHRALAAALEGRADPETLAVHKRGAGDLGAAARYASAAADDAVSALAFDRAARLYRQALELMSLDPTAARALQARLAAALTAAGRGPEAAAAYRAAAEGAPVAEALDLRRRAAEQLLISGHIESGLALLDEVLTGVGLRLPMTPKRALASLATRRLQVAVRGLGFRARDTSQIAPAELTRVDICWSVAVGLGIVDTIRAADFQARNLLLALRAGERYRIARAVALEAGFAAAEGKTARADRLLAHADDLAPEHPHARGLVQLMAGMAAFFRGEWQEAHGWAETAQVTLRDQWRGVTWERDNAHMCSLWAQLYLGRLRDVIRNGGAVLQEGRERGDNYLVTSLRTRLDALIHLAGANSEAARRGVDEALGAWTTRGYHFQHFNRLAVAAQIALYDGDGQRALTAISAELPMLRRALLPRIVQVKIELAHLRGGAALLAGHPSKALRDARVLERIGLPWADALAALLRAGLERTPDSWNGAAARLERLGMRLHAAAARRRWGEQIGATDAIGAAEDVFANEGIADPKRYAAMLAPISSS